MNQVISGGDSATVLIVDDVKEVADSYSNILEDEYDVIAAYGAEEGLEKISSEVDVVLLDRRMPNMSGDEFLNEIRSRGFDCRVVLVTAVTPDTDIISLDFDDYIVKPVSPEKITSAIERMLARNKLEDNIQEAFSLASKMATLEAKMDIEDLEASEEYARLESRLAEFRDMFAEIDPNEDLFAKLSTTKMEALFTEK